MKRGRGWLISLDGNGNVIDDIGFSIERNGDVIDDIDFSIERNGNVIDDISFFHRAQRQCHR